MGSWFSCCTQSNITDTYDGDMCTLTNNTCTYQDANTVTGAIEYATDATDPNADNRVYKYTYKINDTTAAITETEHDRYKRLKKKYTIGNKTFTRSSVYTQTRLDYQWDSAGGTTDISHDACGRISKARAGDYTTWYSYDQYGQLIRENNQALAKSFVYMYNNDGNLTSVKEYGFTTGTLSGTPVTTTFGYDEDKLINFNGTAIAYNAIGCPTTYDGKSATWNRGKLSRLSSGSSANGTDVYSFDYNAQGQRVTKAYSFAEGTNPIYGGQLIGSEKRFYYDNSGRLIAENTVKEYYGVDDEEEKIIFLYDESSIIGMQHTVGSVTTPYYFHRNPLGDVVGIYNTSGTLVAKYIYDAWGNCTISGETTDIAVAQANPIRYRGYYYDEDTGLYYCNARYYSPKWRRFISPANSALNPYAVNGLNTYVYANNNPVGSSYIFSSNASVAQNSQSRIAQSNNLNNSVNASTKMHIAQSKSNKVLMTHRTTSLIENAIIGGFIGNISYTTTKQLNEADGFYYYSNVGNGPASYGVGMNWGDWYGMNVYVSENIGMGMGAQITPWFTFGAELSLLEGVSLSTGIISGNTTHEISADIGWGTIAGAYAFAKAMAFFPSPGARALAGALACLIFIVDLFD